MLVYMVDYHKFGTKGSSTISDLQYLTFSLIPFLTGEGGIGMIGESWMEKTGSFESVMF